MQKITAALLGLLLTGCATVSQYNQGCRDGIVAFVEQGLHAGIDQSVVDRGCDALEAQNKNQIGAK